MPPAGDKVSVPFFPPLVEPTGKNPATPPGRIIDKQSQAEVVIIRLGKGESAKMSVAAMKDEIQSRVFETPDVKTQRVIIMSKSGEVVADMTRK